MEQSPMLTPARAGGQKGTGGYGSVGSYASMSKFGKETNIPLKGLARNDSYMSVDEPYRGPLTRQPVTGPGPQILYGNTTWRRFKLVGSIVIILIVTIFNSMLQLLVAQTMISGDRVPAGASRSFRVLVACTGGVMVILSVFFIMSTFAAMFAIYHYREEPELNLNLMGIPAHDVPSVDVMLPRYKEPWSLFKPTVEAALNLEYPGRVEVYVLDDGADAELRENMTRELGLGTRPGLHYTVREDRRYAKAGNMQHGLRISSGDIICCFDADMVAHSDFLIRLVPHVLQHNAKLGRWQLSEEVGLVQTPQNFYNGDDPVVEEMDGKMTQLMKVFYPSFSGLGAAPCIGTGYLVQRAALDDVGGFACGLAVEDVTTSVLILSAGWQCRWVTQNLVEGLSPASLSEFYDQRMRWTAGGLQQLFYQGVVLRRVPVKPIWGAEWDEQIKRGVPGMSKSARFAWLPLTVYYVIPISVILYCYLAMLCQIVIDWRDDHVVPVYLGIAVIIIVTFYNFGLAYPMGNFRDLQLSARALYVYLPVFIYALWMLALGKMNPLRNPRFKASSEAYSSGSNFPAVAWINVGVVVVGWTLWGVDLYISLQHDILIGMKLCIGGEAVMMTWLTWAMLPILREAMTFCLGSRQPVNSMEEPRSPLKKQNSTWGK